MKDMTEVLLNAKSKYCFKDQKEFVVLIKKVTKANSNLELDWDDGAGEEWARLISRPLGIVCMINAKIGIAFIRNNYTNDSLTKLLKNIYVEYTEDYDTAEWCIDLKTIKQKVPEIRWCACEEAVNTKNFSLKDFYFATV